MQVSVVSVAKRCVHSSELFRITEQGVEAHQVGARLVSSELCAAAIREEAHQLKRVP